MGYLKPSNGDFGTDWFPAMEQNIQQMNDHCASKNTKYADYAAALRNWFRRRQSIPSKSFPGNKNETVKQTIRDRQLADHEKNNGSFNDGILQF